MSSFLFLGFLGCLGSFTVASSAFFGDLDLFLLGGDLDLLFLAGDLERDFFSRSGDFSVFTTATVDFGPLRFSGDLERLRDRRDFLRSSSLEEELLELEELLERLLRSPISRRTNKF